MSQKEIHQEIQASVAPHSASQKYELNLLDLWEDALHEKKTILLVFLSVVIAAVIYVFSVKPVYEGKALVEVGQIVSASSQLKSGISLLSPVSPLEDPDSLQFIIMAQKTVTAAVPKKSDQLIALTYRNTDRQAIEPALQDAVDFMLKRHTALEVEYQKSGIGVVKSTALVGNIKVSEGPVKPRKPVVIGFAMVFGFILGVVVALLRRAIQKSRAQKLKAV